MEWTRAGGASVRCGEPSLRHPTKKKRRKNAPKTSLLRISKIRTTYREDTRQKKGKKKKQEKQTRYEYRYSYSVS